MAKASLFGRLEKLLDLGKHILYDLVKILGGPELSYPGCDGLANLIARRRLRQRDARPPLQRGSNKVQFSTARAAILALTLVFG
jgi:hypothetical protein